MGQQKDSVYEIIAGITGEDPFEIQKQVEGGVQHYMEADTENVIVVSESFPCFIT